ncbi:hypothetical protein JTE90_011926 [Oedothorax gibbosus]|uniref:Uncharacterized protein n=1 Tax=Oedothorax gibbosus TaxID=931172 RepID=A0AAV6V143_9ARAC|nr:hypothetical protein JTE90_011926 [Oedothorax gibbosus]
MKSEWIFLLVIIAVLGIAGAKGNDCNATVVNPCFHNATHYERVAFPLYGQDEGELDETCRKINESFYCLNDYIDSCHNQPECDEQCEETIFHIELFFNATGLLNLQSELCEAENHLRKVYLDNYVCLGDNAHHYATCHNISQKSVKYMETLSARDAIIKAQCCYMSWFQDCIKNATEICGQDAVDYVSYGLYTLIAHVEEQMCKNNPVKCEMPPLPIYTEDEDETSSAEEEILDFTSKNPDNGHNGASNHLVCSTLLFSLTSLFVQYIYFH